MATLPSQSLSQLFTEARTFSHWLPQPVADATLHEVYDLMKMGPTSANLCPARIIFVRSGADKERLVACLSPTNVDKVRAAPVTAIIAFDTKFYDQITTLYPQSPQYRDAFLKDQALAASTAFRNGSLQGAYLIMAARAVGLDCGPMSGFDNAKVDSAFLSGTAWSSNFLCNLGHGDRSRLSPRLPRLGFDVACRIV